MRFDSTTSASVQEVARLVAKLSDIGESPVARWSAAQALGQIGGDAHSAVETLEAFLSDRIRGVRFQAAAAIARIDSTRGDLVPLLVEALGDDYWSHRLAAVEGLGALGAVAREALGAVLEQSADEDPTVRERSLGTLVKIDRDHPAVLATLLLALDDCRSRVRARGAELLGTLAPESDTAILPLVRRLGDETPYVRYAAALAVTAFGNEAIAPVAEALDEDDAYARESALTALHHLGQTAAPVLDRIVVALNDPITGVRLRARTVLADLDCDRAREAVARFDRDEEARLRDAVAAAQREAQRIVSRDEIRAELAPDGNFPNPAPLCHWVELHLPPDREFLVAVHRGRDRPDRLTIWTNSVEGYRRVLDRESMQDLSTRFEEPNVFRFLDRDLIQIPHRESCTARLHEHLILAFTPDGEVEPVEYVSPTLAYSGWLEPGETIWRNERTLLSDGDVGFEFFVWDEGDGNGSPGTWRVRGQFDLIEEPAHGDRPSLRLEPVTFERDAAQSSRHEKS